MKLLSVSDGSLETQWRRMLNWGFVSAFAFSIEGLCCWSVPFSPISSAVNSCAVSAIVETCHCWLQRSSKTTMMLKIMWTQDDTRWYELTGIPFLSIITIKIVKKGIPVSLSQRLGQRCTSWGCWRWASKYCFKVFWRLTVDFLKTFALKISS